jgi:restriction endonuclease S subunit
MYASVGAIAVLGIEATWNQAILGIEARPGFCHVRFLMYWLQNLKPDLPALVRSNTQDNLNAEQVGNFPFPVLPMDRQRAIADHLDAETTRIDALIAKKRRMIELLEKRRQALITASVEGRDTGADQTGDGVSEVRPLRFYAEVALGRQRSPQHENGVHMVSYLRAANVKDGALTLEDVKVMNFTPAEQQVFALRPGDILVTEGSGSLRAVGASAVWSDEFPGVVCFQNTLLRLRPRVSTDPRFLSWWCRSAFASGLFASVAEGANIFHLSAERVRALPMTHLSLDVQRAIADVLDIETTRINRLTRKLRNQIDLLTEHRQALITAAVTGELDIAKVAA